MERKIIKFWCDKCRQDWNIIAIRRWLSTLFPDVWEAKCPECKRMMIRLVNDAANDPYFRRSKLTYLERKKFADDLIQMGDPRFDFLYPQHKKEREEKERQAEKDKFLTTKT